VVNSIATHASQPKAGDVGRDGIPELIYIYRNVPRKASAWTSYRRRIAI